MFDFSKFTSVNLFDISFFFFQAEDGIRDADVTGVQTCALPICLRWPGPLELELMRHATSGQLYLLEINPRFPAWIHLTVSAGQNLPWALVRILLGEDVAPFAGYHAGVMSLRRSIDITCSLGIYESLVIHGEVDHHNLDAELIRPQWVSSRTAR